MYLTSSNTRRYIVALLSVTEGGQVSIQLSTNESALPAPYAQIKITDNGVGINPDFLPCVFDVFCQADSSKTRKFGGLGLGLAIVYNIVKMHGETIQAYSAGIGKGATFTILLSMKQTNAAL
ncbi:hypothetical protein NIES2101_18660 [Calothrix sp. HK-06]|nr:hypothetical protein NIES2101_18660 [Calothrix sp. HK-06]